MNDPYSEGRNVDRSKDHENPYPFGTTPYCLWEDGYEDGNGEENSPWPDKELIAWWKEMEEQYGGEG